MDTKKLVPRRTMLTMGLGIATGGQATAVPGACVPTEAMVKREQRFGQATRDQEFPAPEVGENGSKIRTRGFADAMDRVGRHCFARWVKSVFRCRRCPVTLSNKRRLCLRR